MASTLEQKLRAAKVDLVLDDEHLVGPNFATGRQSPGSVVQTKKGKSIPADFIFVAVGNTPNTQIVERADPSAVTERKLISINDKLQVGFVCSTSRRSASN